MKKYIPILVVIVLVLSIIGVARSNPAWASPKASVGVDAPLKTLIDVTANGTSNVGGVCQITAAFLTTNVDNIEADAEVPIAQSKTVTSGVPSDQHLLFPGCHFVFSKGGSTLADPVKTTDATLKVCFGASPELQMAIYYYRDEDYKNSNPTWNLLPSTMEDNNRLICAPAQYNGVYMPAGLVVPPAGSTAGDYQLFWTVNDGTVETPPSEITVTASGAYAIGGICLFDARYDVSGLSDTIQVQYPLNYTEDTKTVPFDAYSVNGDLFYFPGCHIWHLRNDVVQKEMNMPSTPTDGVWKICFATIPDKTMTIYYYADDLTTIVPPWKPLVTTTANGMACADLVDFTAVYVPTGK